MIQLPKWLPVVVFLFCFPTMLGAAETMRLKFPDGYVYLFDKPCVEPAVLANIKVDWRDKYKSSEVMMNGQNPKMCWAEFKEEEIYYFVWDDGSHGPMPMKVFTADLGV